VELMPAHRDEPMMMDEIQAVVKEVRAGRRLPRESCR
jgi:hypothetical protein